MYVCVYVCIYIYVYVYIYIVCVFFVCNRMLNPLVRQKNCWFSCHGIMNFRETRVGCKAAILWECDQLIQHWYRHNMGCMIRDICVSMRETGPRLTIHFQMQR